MTTSTSLLHGGIETLNNEAVILTCKNCDNRIRWKIGERLDHLFEQRCDQLAVNGKKDHPAVVTNEITLSYLDLDNRANQLARHLRKQGIQAGDHVGLLFDKSFHTYVALLAVLKINAAYVPLDAGFPTERIRFILNDADVSKILTISSLQSCFCDISSDLIVIDECEDTIAIENSARLSAAEKGIPKNELSYIIYTSGTTGNPKGVAIEHPSICNFVKVAGEIYGITESDRVYQGMTIAFDFSVEELWVPLIAGATLIPGKPDTRLVGKDLMDFLRVNHITALCCVPTLLATLDEDLPTLRFLLVSGEACPHDLVVRWHRPGRTFLNAYGPTEATVTATWTALHPQRPVTIGQPLPTYSVVILSEHSDTSVPKGELGEIGIAGIGLAKGYLNLEERTNRSFISDFLNIENNVSKRIYRTGDLGRINEDDEIEYKGRIDTQVKIRGYRIELTEIESVLLQIPQIAQVVVNTFSPEPGIQELVAYYTLNADATEFSPDIMTRTMRNHLPGYMIPAYLEELPFIPMLPSDKADRKKLPAPRGQRFVSSSREFTEPKTELQKNIAASFADILEVDRISINDNFFDDLGGHSLLIAKFTYEIRQRCKLDVSMKDVYQHPTTEQLAEFLSTKSIKRQDIKNLEDYRIASNMEYYGCGTLQLLYYATYLLLLLSILTEGMDWIYSAKNVFDTYVRVVSFALIVFVLLTALPIAVKWLIIGKWTKQTIPIWGWRYFRFWLVKQQLDTSPMIIFKGSPIFNVYLRLLGAKIGSNVVIYSKIIPICTDLFSVGSNSVLRKDSILPGYRAQSGYIHTGSVSIGHNTFVGEAAVLDIETSMGNDSQLGHASSLQSNQHVPPGEHYHGSPAEQTETNYCTVERRAYSYTRKILFSLFQILGLFFVAIPLPFLLGRYGYDSIDSAQTNSMRNFFLSALPLSLGTYIFVFLTGLFVIATIPRILNIFLKTETVYPLYGFHYIIFNAVSLLSNSKFYNHVFGDSSYIIGYLKLVGYKFLKIVQTGSNFGTTQKHDNPFLCEIGSGTIISDGLSMINAQVSNSSFMLSKVSIGNFSYLGNDIFYPSHAKVGENCLLATKVMIPLDGAVRKNIGLLGSPCFEIPRMTRRDECIADLNETTRITRIKQKNRSNILSAAGYLFFQWLYIMVMSLFTYFAAITYHMFGIFGLAIVVSAAALTTIEFFAMTDRIGRGFKKLEPHVCSIYESYFWNVIERYWKISHSVLLRLFTGTPFKTVVSRMLGAKIGKKVFDDGLHLTEATLVEIGDYCTINTATILQSHSLEEGVFKSDRIKIGTGCTIGCHAFVHYGVVMGDNTILDADSFLMKGEVLDADTIWRGNPAKIL